MTSPENTQGGDLPPGDAGLEAIITGLVISPEKLATMVERLSETAREIDTGFTAIEVLRDHITTQDEADQLADEHQRLRGKEEVLRTVIEALQNEQRKNKIDNKQIKCNI